MLINVKKREKCPLCNNLEFNVLFEGYTNEGYIKKFLNWRLPYFNTNNYFLCKILECLNCKFIFHQNVLPKNDFNKYVGSSDSNYTKFKKFLKKKSNLKIQKYYIKNVNFIFHILKKNLNSKILDFGCGWGDWMEISEKCGFDTYGAEIDILRIKYLNKKKHKLINFENFDNNMKFDFINTEQVFEHLENPIYFINRFHDILNKNGFVRISVPNGINIKKNLINNKNWLERRKNVNNSLNPIWLFEHINCFNSESIIKMMQNNGFKLYRMPFFKFLKCQYGKTSILRLLYDAFHHCFLSKKTNLSFIKI